VLIKRRDVRLRERRIGPYKCPAVDKDRGRGRTLETEAQNRGLQEARNEETNPENRRWRKWERKKERKDPNKTHKKKQCKGERKKEQRGEKQKQNE
jgi:hypothetical protein